MLCRAALVLPVAHGTSRLPGLPRSFRAYGGQSDRLYATSKEGGVRPVGIDIVGEVADPVSDHRGNNGPVDPGPAGFRDEPPPPGMEVDAAVPLAVVALLHAHGLPVAPEALRQRGRTLPLGAFRSRVPEKLSLAADHFEV